ncbi:SDR family oxidoreductase [Candidatus Woesearchaeota archaeon]|nr:SDR family oxidoreductase [Candidatus Woesearchaeota archaeon]
MKYVVTGGAGFIGSNLVQALLEKNHEVVVIDDLSSGSLHNIEPFMDRVKFVKGSVESFELLKKEFACADIVVHLAAIASVPKTIEDPVLASAVNTEGTLKALLAAKHGGVKRFVFASSAAYYGNAEKMPKVESMAPQPESPYAIHKVTGEYYCKVFSQKHSVDAVSFRFFNVYGPKQDPKSPYSGVISIFINSVLNDKPITIFGDGHQTRDFVFVDDVVKAIILACESEQKFDGEVFNIATAKEISLLDLIKNINTVLEKNVMPSFSDVRAGDVKRSVADISKAKKVLGFNPTTSFEEGLKKTIEWYKKV